ncbi:MAG: hypothetical protein PHT77_01395 [Bacteroidales bacterium]|nr:hypothetical protein [Bacteroidales bacterium]
MQQFVLLEKQAITRALKNHVDMDPIEFTYEQFIKYLQKYLEISFFDINSAMELTVPESIEIIKRMSDSKKIAAQEIILNVKADLWVDDRFPL